MKNIAPHGKSVARKRRVDASGRAVLTILCLVLMGSGCNRHRHPQPPVSEILQSFISLLSDTAEHASCIEDGVDTLCGLFADYWESTAQAVFPATAAA